MFHIVLPSPWPFFVSIASFFFVSGLAFYFHRVSYGGYFVLFGLFFLFLLGFFWFYDIIYEATFLGDHTQVVRTGLKRGFFLFIVSEIMLFFGFFWAFFHSALSPSSEFGLFWPPFGISAILFNGVPLYNTVLLIISGFAVTWVHKAIAIGSFKESIDGFLCTILLGIFFIISQLFEYFYAPFDISDSVYGSTFFLLTGLHGFHVFVGVAFLIVCLIRLCLNHFLINHYLGLVFAIWYWHFVDAVWIVLFLSLYCWGGW